MTMLGHAGFVRLSEYTSENTARHLHMHELVMQQAQLHCKLHEFVGPSGQQNLARRQYQLSAKVAMQHFFGFYSLEVFW